MSSPDWSGRYAQRMTALTLATYGSRCHLCLQLGATSADHLLPRSKGGSDSIENLRPAHTLCNSRRGARTVEQFRAQYRPDLLNTTTNIEEWRFFKN